jgi:hypothetical protein
VFEQMKCRYRLRQCSILGIFFRKNFAQGTGFFSEKDEFFQPARDEMRSRGSDRVTRVK